MFCFVFYLFVFFVTFATPACSRIERGLCGHEITLPTWVVVRPVTRLSALADRVSQGELNAPDFVSTSKDEIGVLTESFARMKTSVVQAMKMLET